jgi:hypothetical protein
MFGTPEQIAFGKRLQPGAASDGQLKVGQEI